MKIINVEVPDIPAANDEMSANQIVDLVMGLTASINAVCVGQPVEAVCDALVTLYVRVLVLFPPERDRHSVEILRGMADGLESGEVRAHYSQQQGKDTLQ